DRFDRLGEFEDLEKAIEHQSRSLALTPNDDPDLPRQLVGLGRLYTDRFQYLGEPDDLEKAIDLESRALNLTPDDHPELPLRLIGLGGSYTHRFQHLGKLADLAKAIEHQSRALGLTPSGHPDLSLLLTHLGSSYSNRFWHLNELDDLEKAIEYQSRALGLTPDGHSDSPHRLASLGKSHADRFDRQGELEDLEKAIKYQSLALTSTPDGHPDLPYYHSSQAETFFLQYQHTGDPLHLQNSFESYRRASQMLTGAPRNKFQYALRWADLAFEHSFLDCLEAYHVTMDLLPQFIWLGATTNQRYQDLLITGNLAVNAACAAILHSDLKLALEWLEHGRCVVWNQTLMLRSPLDQLRSSHPDLATRIQIISKQLHDANSESFASRALLSGSVSPEQVAQNRRRMAKEYNDLLAQTRTLPGFEAFLQPMKANDLVRAARNGPIVVINCQKSRCDALLILPEHDNIKHFPLPDFTEKKAKRARSEIETSLRRKGIRERGVKVRQEPGHKDSMESVLGTLWNEIVKPIIDFLGYTNNASRDSLPHITWCLTGALSFLPLHAAGDYSQPRSRVFDYVISSYTPTLTALLLPIPSSLNRDCRILAIGQANTPGHSPLPGTARELEYVKAHTQDRAEYFQLVDGQATTTAVLDAMEKHDWVHLACHAHQNVEDPTKSGFFLHDGTLDLASINQRSFKNKGLAFLSACQTATGDEKLPDEAVHLASGMLNAGYASVIATMWSVHDADAPLVADK
ncbi:hypothetical protein FRC11_014836, partial [Ceratobasidium sp. 423]